MSGEVAVGEICAMPVGTITLLAAAMVVPDISAPTISATFSTLTSLVAASTAPCAEPVVSPITLTILPPKRPPPALTSSVARVTESSIGGMELAIGPVTSNRMPTFTSSALAVAAASAVARRVVAPSSACFRKLISPPVSDCLEVSGERVERDVGQQVLDVRQRLQPSGDEPPHIRNALQVALHEQVVGAGDRIELAHCLEGVEGPGGHVIRGAGITFDHDENRPHCGLASIFGWFNWRACCPAYGRKSSPRDTSQFSQRTRSSSPSPKLGEGWGGGCSFVRRSCRAEPPSPPP